MTELDLYLAGLSIQDRNRILDEREAFDRDGEDFEGPDDWQIGQDRWERSIWG